MVSLLPEMRGNYSITLKLQKNHRKGSHIFIHMHEIYKNTHTHIYKYILSNVVKFTVLM